MSNVKIDNVSIRCQDSPSIDAFARLRVSNPTTIFDSKQLHDSMPLFWDDAQISGSGTSSIHSQQKASTEMIVSLNTAGRRVRQTFMRFNYQPGKSTLVFLTGTLGAIGGGVGITRAMGMYDDNNGIFMKDDEGVVKAVIRSKTSGAVVDNEVAQSAWNLDKFDGTGPSGVTLDVTKSQIVLIDFEWLGVGRVRIGFVINGIPYYCHEFNHSNINSGVYMSTPNLPIRYEIENDGTGAASQLEHICSSVQSEGGTQDNGTLRYISTAGTHLDANAENTIYALIGIKLKATHIDAVMDVVKLSLAEHVGEKTFEWLWILNPIVAGTFTYANETNCSLMSAKGGTTNTVTGGTYIDGEMTASAKRGSGASSNPSNAIRLGSAIDGTVDEMVLCVRPVGGSINCDFEGSITYKNIA